VRAAPAPPLMRVQVALKARITCWAPRVLESPLLGYKRVQGGFEEALVGKEVTIGVRMYLISVARYRPHRPHCRLCGYLQDFLRLVLIMYIVRDSYLIDRHRGYRPPSYPGICRTFSLSAVAAVGAGGTFSPQPLGTPHSPFIRGLPAPVQLREHAREGGSQRPGQLVVHGPRRRGLLVQPRVLERRIQRESGPSRFPIYRATVP
jgi:hypothetical protein